MMLKLLGSPLAIWLGGGVVGGSYVTQNFALGLAFSSMESTKCSNQALTCKTKYKSNLTKI
jgi:hypothetical protein